MIFHSIGTVNMVRDVEEEDYDSDSTVCDVIYRNDDKKIVVSYPYEEYEKLEETIWFNIRFKKLNHFINPPLTT